MAYQVELTAGASRALARLPAKMGVRVARSIEALAANPRPPGNIKLAAKDNVYRVRVGDYRIVYSIQDRRLIVVVIDIGNRRDIYRR